MRDGAAGQCGVACPFQIHQKTGVIMLWHAMPPELNTARLMAGAGTTSMLAVATGWKDWAAALDAQAIEVSARLKSAGEVCSGESGDRAIAAAVPMVSWLATASARAKARATQALAQAAAHADAPAATPPLPEIAMNHITAAVVTATNFLGMSTALIALSETDYFTRMWNQAAAAMDAYQAQTAVNTRFGEPDSIKTNLGVWGLANGLDRVATIARNVALPAKEAIRQTLTQSSGMGCSIPQPAQVTSLFGHPGGTGAGLDQGEGVQIGLLGASPLSHHPLAGGSGPSAGAGLMRADSLPGAGGLSARTPLLAGLLDKPTVAMGPAAVSAESAATRALPDVTPATTRRRCLPADK
ncbi:PPE family protein [Mycobacterium marinum]|uniref:PPE family protein n=1 Tax=Mycobacterium marinum TaxID=1781 RepID=UPI0023589C07|nr:PPE family protein [Mycobacterium marinum]MDC8971141.1 PPE family protein [Mycobacterium marinum]